jgi:hypothetical protein
LSEMNNATISLVKPSARRQMATIIAPTTMKGLRRPHFDLDSSARVPTIGWTSRPDNGPAIHTSEVLLLLRPRLSKYGVQYVISTPQVKLLCDSAVSSLCDPGEEHAWTYVIPRVQKFSKSMRIASELPLTEGCPVHLDISAGLLGLRTQPSSSSLSRSAVAAGGEFVTVGSSKSSSSKGSQVWESASSLCRGGCSSWSEVESSR